VEEANRFLREQYVAEFNSRFQHAAAQRGTAFTGCPRRDPDLIFSLQFERTVGRDNTVSFQHMTLQIDEASWRGTLAGCTVMAHQHPDGTLTLTYGPRKLGSYSSQGRPILTSTEAAAVEKTPGGKSRSGLSHRVWKSGKNRRIPTFQQPRRRPADQT
jgi:hypothetical protein